MLHLGQDRTEQHSTPQGDQPYYKDHESLRYFVNILKGRIQQNLDFLPKGHGQNILIIFRIKGEIQGSMFQIH